ncbi:MAG: DUF362 domain-containing protein [Victivallales bacterium]|nr:DUF362 domain-containing protein [Victivallales bacterium]MCF7888714.1 DUF362 domain-containing protein [Victivallales bacterium]
MNTQKTIVSALYCDNYNPATVIDKVKKAITASGGLPKKIKPGTKVLINPNLLTAKSPENAVTTHPSVIKGLIHYLKSVNITDITIGDSPAGSHDWKKLWDITGMSDLARTENVQLLAFENTKTVTIDNDLVIPVLKEIDDFDAVISVPKLKTHLLTKITGAVKNTYGMIPGKAKTHFHGTHPSPRKMSKFIAKLYDTLKPDFVLMDAVESMEGEGPNTGKPVQTGIILAGKDGVAVDAAACSVYGYKPEDILIIKEAAKAGFGIIDSDRIEKTGDAWHTIKALKAKKAFLSDVFYKIPEKLFFIVSYITSCRPKIDSKKCVKCGKCMEECSQSAIYKKNNKYKVKNKKCILCMCCIETCPFKAIKLKRSWIWDLFI